MANNKQQEAQQEQVVTTVSGVEEFFKKNKNLIEWCAIGVLVIILGIFALNRWVFTPQKEEARNQMFQAEQIFRDGDYETALNGDGNILGFNQVIDNYGKKGGNSVYLYAGLCNLHLGNYQEAINMLNKYSTKDNIMQGRAFCATGDAYSNLKDYGSAISFYKKAAALGNTPYAASYLLKAGLLCEEAGKADEALKLYREIETKYPQTLEGIDIQKYITRIETGK